MAEQDTDNHTPHRPIRVDQDLWDEFGALVGDRNRARMVRDYIRWYVGRPGVAAPKRPTKSERTDIVLRNSGEQPLFDVEVKLEPHRADS